MLLCSVGAQSVTISAPSLVQYDSYVLTAAPTACEAAVCKVINWVYQLKCLDF